MRFMPWTAMLVLLLLAGPVSALTLDELRTGIPTGCDYADTRGFRVRLSVDDTAIIRSYTEYWCLSPGRVAVVNFLDGEALSCRFYMSEPSIYRGAFPLRIDYIAELFRGGNRFFGLINSGNWTPENARWENDNDGIRVTYCWDGNNRIIYHFSLIGNVPIKIEKNLGDRRILYEIEGLPNADCPEIIFRELARCGE